MFAKRVDAFEMYAETNQHEKEVLLDYFEKYVTTCLYDLLFSSPAATDEEKDIAIQNRIRQLSWVGTKHLDCAIDETNAEVILFIFYMFNSHLPYYKKMLVQNTDCLLGS